jgi:hypothetical protein
MYHQTFFKSNKYNAVKQSYNGNVYDSKFEAQVAADLDLRVKAKDIKAYDRQYVVVFEVYNKVVSNGEEHFIPYKLGQHRVDFRIHHNDGTFELYEAKGVETADYKKRRKYLEDLWLPEHPDHIYTVVKQKTYYR